VDGVPRGLDQFIKAGPLFGRCFTPASPALDLDKWQSHGSLLTQKILNKNTDDGFSLAEAVRVYQYYLPIYFWVESLMKSQPHDSPLIVGLSCPQGGGKTTIVDALNLLFSDDGQVCAEMSLDDFYLTNAEQRQVAASNDGNALLELRGNPGTHDIQLANDLLTSISSSSSNNKSDSNNFLIPRYDKSKFDGRGDRCPQDEWTKLPSRPNIVLFEGWCFGFSSLLNQQNNNNTNANSANSIDDERLLPIDQRLATDYHELHKLMQAWVVIEVESPTWVYKWREEAEAVMRSKGKPAMTPEQISDFVDRYMPAYRHYLPGLYKNGPDGSEGKPVLSFQVDAMRNPVSIEDALPFKP
jgi:D-glycerate 3-kinase